MHAALAQWGRTALELRVQTSRRCAEIASPPMLLPNTRQHCEHLNTHPKMQVLRGRPRDQQTSPPSGLINRYRWVSVRKSEMCRDWCIQMVPMRQRRSCNCVVGRKNLPFCFQMDVNGTEVALQNLTSPSQGSDNCPHLLNKRLAHRQRPKNVTFPARRRFFRSQFGTNQGSGPALVTNY